MGRLVMKFGGTSVENIERIRNVARHVKREVDAGNEIAVVVSAMAGTTNRLVDWCREAAPLHDAREYDVVVASGEQVTSGLLAIALDYRASTAEALAGAGEIFDLVLAMEVVEHVADVRGFLGSCAAMVKPNGLMIAATINRTLKSFALAIVGAEYVLGWLPRGTHRWDKLVTPNELEAAMERAGLRFIEIKGVIYDLLADAWKLSDDVDVNYMVAAAGRD